MNRLELEDLTVGFPSRPLVQGAHAVLEAGDWAHVQGSNGAGKTTLLSVLASFLNPLAGRVLWNGESVFSDPASFRRQVRVFGHETALFEGLSVRQNWELYTALFSLSGTVETRIAGGVGPERPVNRLSQGQKRRVELAALLPTPRPLMLLDEPSASLDEESTGELHNQLRSLADRGSILVTASPKPMPGADEIWRIRRGGLEVGP